MHGHERADALSLAELPEILTVDQEAVFLKIGRAAAYQAVHRGDIPSLRIGRTIRVPRFRLEALLLGQVGVR